jgi:hypothetical protein
MKRTNGGLVNCLLAASSCSNGLCHGSHFCLDFLPVMRCDVSGVLPDCIAAVAGF